MKLYNDKDALYIIKDMMEKEVIRLLKSEQQMNSKQDEQLGNPVITNDLVSASNAGYVSGIMWVKGELAKIEEVLK